MKILVLSFYHPPDLSAGSFRIGALLNALEEQLPGDVEIDVITTTPNRYTSFSVDAPAVERHGRTTVHRISLPQHRSGIVDQSRAFGAYLWGALKIIRRNDYDLVVATSSRLMTAAMGAAISKMKRIPLYLDIRDIFVDTISGVFSGILTRPAVALFSAMERLTIRRALLVNLVSDGFEEYFRSRYPAQRFTFHTNGIDSDFVDMLSVSNPANDVLKVVYAGNIGEGQGLHLIIPELAKRLAGRVRFRILGAGGRLELLQSELAKQNIDNVEIIPPVARKALIAEYAQADILFLHLNDVQAFEKVLPSKLFEYGATGKPIWAGIKGYPSDFAAQNIENIAIFPPCDIDRAVSVLGSLEIKTINRESFLKKFDRKAIMARMARDIASLL